MENNARNGLIFADRFLSCPSRRNHRPRRPLVHRRRRRRRLQVLGDAHRS